MTLRPYQELGVQFLLRSGGRALLGDEQGLGKTVQAIEYMRRHILPKRVLIVCPASMKLVWRNEVEKWAPGVWPCVWPCEHPGDVDIINYDILERHKDKLMDFPYELLILDECQYIKSAGAKRTKAVHEIARHIPRRILLSGTPLINRPQELWSPLHTINPYVWDKFWPFGLRYCNGQQRTLKLYEPKLRKKVERKIWDFSGASNIDELKQRLEPVMLRRLKVDVLPEIPDKIRTDIEIELPKSAMTEYQAIMKDVISWLADQGRHAEAERAEYAQHLVKVNHLRQCCALAKISAILELVDTMVDNGHKVIVFGEYVDPLREIYRSNVRRAVQLLGQTSAKQRMEAIDRFQDDPNIQVFVGSTAAAGTGITLTAADTVIFADLPWTPAEQAQAEDRAHRFGQTRSVNVYRVLASGTIDTKIAKLLDRKSGVIAQILGGVAVANRERSVLGELLFELTGDFFVP